LGKLGVTALNPAVAAAKGTPYLGKIASGTQKTVGALTGAPANMNELARNVALSGTLGAGAGSLEGYGGLSPQQASLIGFAPTAAYVPALVQAARKAPKAAVSLYNKNPWTAGKKEFGTEIANRTNLEKNAKDTFGKPSEKPLHKEKKLKEPGQNKIVFFLKSMLQSMNNWIKS
jgi:hypothetical protein